MSRFAARTNRLAKVEQESAQAFEEALKRLSEAAKRHSRRFYDRKPSPASKRAMLRMLGEKED